ncbi:MAG TPA: short-chain dehydrogenase, partial [Phormidium sp.]
PALADSLLLLIGFRLQRTEEPKSEDARNNFYESVPTDSRIDGDFTKQVIPSVTDWLDKNLRLPWA